MIHSYKLNGYNIVLDIESASVHAVDDLAFDIINLYQSTSSDKIVSDLFEKYSESGVTRQDICDCISDVDELINQKKLFRAESIKPDVEKISNLTKPIKALCLHVAHTCNLDCEYCFARQGKFQEKDNSNVLMSYEIGKKALDFLIENSANRYNLEVDFFGGEPLMNWDNIKKLVEYARSREAKFNKRFRFTLTTNGVLLNDDVIEFSNREMDNVVLSLDGRKEVHDYFRKTINGQGSYDVVLPKFLDFVEKRKGKGYYVRGTFTKNNVDFAKDIFEMADMGFTELSMEPVVCATNDKYALGSEDLPILFEQYEILAKEMLKREKENRPFTFYHYMLDLSHGPCIYKRVSGCGAGCEYLAVTPTGELYPCHQFVGNSDFLMGTLDTGVVNDTKREEFKKCNIYNKSDCDNCWAKLYCSGGCAANAYNATGHINGIYEYGCELFKKRMECAIMMQVSRAMQE